MKNTHGGLRAGAGRPIGSGTGPGPDARIHRIAVMLSNDELKQLLTVAKKRNLPRATVLYDLSVAPLKRAALTCKRKR